MNGKKLYNLIINYIQNTYQAKPIIAMKNASVIVSGYSFKLDDKDYIFRFGNFGNDKRQGIPAITLEVILELKRINLPSLNVLFIVDSIVLKHSTSAIDLQFKKALDKLNDSH